VLGDDLRLTAGQNRDRARGGEVHPTRHRRLEAADAGGRRERGEPAQLARIVRARVDPGGAWAQSFEQALRAEQHLGDGLRRRQAREDAVGRRADGAFAVPPT